MKKRTVLLVAATSATLIAYAQSTKTIAVLVPAFTSPFHVAIRDGASDFAKGLGWNVETPAPVKEGDFAEQANTLEQLIQKKVSAISVNPINPAALTGSIKKANTANIPVFVHNGLTPLEDKNARVVEYVGYNQWKGGVQAGEYAAKLLNGKGKVFILDGIPGFHSNRRAGGFKTALAKYPGITVVGETPADWEREKAVNVATAALQKDPDIKLFYGVSDEMAIGAGIAARRLGKDVFTIGIDGNDVTLDLIAKGEVTATLGVYPRKMGEVVVSQMQKVLSGQKVPQYLETPSIIVNKANLAQYRAGKTWKAPRAGKAEVDNGKP